MPHFHDPNHSIPSKFILPEPSSEVYGVFQHKRLLVVGEHVQSCILQEELVAKYSWLILTTAKRGIPLSLIEPQETRESYAFHLWPLHSQENL